MKVYVYENSEEMIRAVVMEGDEVKNIVSGFEDENISRSEFIAAARSGFEQSGPYDPGEYSGLDMARAAEQIGAADKLIAEITGDSVEMHPENMGLAGHILFEIGLFF